MHAMKMIAAAGILAATAAVPALADDAMSSPMGTMSMMKSGETVAIMPDGHMGTTMMSSSAMTPAMMKGAKPISHCMMVRMGSDGKMYAVDTLGSANMKSCESMAK